MLERLVLQRRSLSITFNDIADELGISRSLLYAYYESVPAMLDALFLEHARKLDDRFRPILSASTGFRRKAIECSQVYLLYGSQSGPLLQLILREAPGDSPLGSRSRAYFRNLLRMLARETSKGLRVSVREAFVSLELLASIPEALARLIRDGQIDEATASRTCERLIGAAIASLAPTETA